ncbi:MAG: glycerol-3-phosphate 1-O-acyltransferase PlsY [Ruminococcaceae bacterium]|nr:glycerol-3-phosphate 1-O-acyltransferase PlsY [Oscillospiraceae bacterium]
MLSFLSNSWLALLLSAVIAYLLGSINWAIIITRLFSHKDIRTYGSGNAGATNVLRSQGVLPAILTTLGDLGKGVAAVLIGAWLLTNLNLSGSVPAELRTFAPNAAWLIGGYFSWLFCILGHMYPVFYGFKGGKGVMATLGTMIVLDWRVAVMALGLFLVTVAISRMVSLGSVVAATYVPVLTLVFRGWVDEMSTDAAVFCTVLSAIIAAVVIWKHGANIRRISEGTERRIGEDRETK